MWEFRVVFLIGYGAKGIYHFFFSIFFFWSIACIPQGLLVCISYFDKSRSLSEGRDGLSYVSLQGNISENIEMQPRDQELAPPKDAWEEESFNPEAGLGVKNLLFIICLRLIR